MSKYKKSAKDLAFDKEREKLNKRIRELELLIKTKEEENKFLRDFKDKEKRQLETELEQVKDWNRRLLEYMDLSEEDMRKIVDKDKTMAEITSSFAAMQNVMKAFGGVYGGL